MNPIPPAKTPASPAAGQESESRMVASLTQSDLALVRVLEDLIDTLIGRGVIQFTDLPQAAQAKLLERRQTREALRNALQLLPADDSEIALPPPRNG